MNNYKITFQSASGVDRVDYVTAMSENEAVHDFKEVYRHGIYIITKIEEESKLLDTEKINRISKSIFELMPFNEMTITIDDNHGLHIINKCCYFIELNKIAEEEWKPIDNGFTESNETEIRKLIEFLLNKIEPGE